MATFEVTVTYHFDTTYEIEADSYEQAEYKAQEEATEWKPYSSTKGYTEDWYQIEIETAHIDGELED